jgi:hypothetical protein
MTPDFAFRRGITGRGHKRTNLSDGFIQNDILYKHAPLLLHCIVPHSSPCCPRITAVVASRSLPPFTPTETEGRQRFHGVATHYLNSELRQQNDEKECRQSAKRRVVGNARILSCEAILEAEERREQNTTRGAAQDTHRSDQKSSVTVSQAKKKRRLELENAEGELHAQGLENYCSVIKF